MIKRIEPQVAVTVTAVVGLFVLSFFLPIGRWALELTEFMRGAGATGIVVFVAIYAVSTVLLIPASALTIGAGFAYGIPAVAIVWPAAMLGAYAAFILGRSTAREWIAAKVARSARFKAIDDATRTDGFKLVLLLRLSPAFPYGLLNYVLGLTKVRLRDYLIASAAGMLPGTLLYVYLGCLMTSAAQVTTGELPASGPWVHVVFFMGLAATILATVLITRLAKAQLASHIG